MTAAIWAELLKVRRSKMPWLTALAFTVAAAVGGLFMYIWQDPARARSLGLLGAKAQLATADADWPGFLALLAQITAVGGLLIFGTIVIWVFGREFSDRTAKDLLALPTSRTAIVAAKFTVIGGWCLALTVQLFVLGLLIGAALGLPGWSATAVGQSLARLLAIAALSVVLASPFALAASAGRGYLPAVGAMFAVTFCTQIIAALGYGHLFAWSVPSLISGVAGPDQAPIGVVGYLGVGLIGAAGVAGTAAWWRNADQ
ncbi:ABC transporter permease [Catellatospora citrea]|uniref:ABC transporter permease n=1 Tax=Catellatospora citrea TaxID=53366 RepID=A0A8J3P043_9ACTN|nr:ABC transporter permease [Catellatospora citrea]RKE10478.1 ABC-2 type transport system permease protein [Catellatospora citrea]GIF99013.1 ABC transporter permease [Catellatospora citrea]